MKDPEVHSDIIVNEFSVKGKQYYCGENNETKVRWVLPKCLYNKD